MSGARDKKGCLIALKNSKFGDNLIFKNLITTKSFKYFQVTNFFWLLQKLRLVLQFLKKGLKGEYCYVDTNPYSFTRSITKLSGNLPNSSFFDCKFAEEPRVQSVMWARPRIVFTLAAAARRQVLSV